MTRVVELLIPDAEHAVAVERVEEEGLLVTRQGAGQVEAADLGAERAGESAELDVVGHGASPGVAREACRDIDVRQDSKRAGAFRGRAAGGEQRSGLPKSQRGGD